MSPTRSWRSVASSAGSRRAISGDPRGHLRHPHRPVPAADVQYGRIVEFWSALSVGLLLLAIVALVSLRLVPWWAALGLALAGYAVLEAAFRRRLTLLTLRVELVLAMISAAILVWEGLFLIVIAAVAGLALVVVLDNVRELRWGSASSGDATTPSAGGRVGGRRLRDPESWIADSAWPVRTTPKPSTTTAATSGTASRNRPRPTPACTRSTRSRAVTRTRPTPLITAAIPRPKATTRTSPNAGRPAAIGTEQDQQRARRRDEAAGQPEDEQAAPGDARTPARADADAGEGVGDHGVVRVRLVGGVIVRIAVVMVMVVAVAMVGGRRATTSSDLAQAASIRR